MNDFPRSPVCGVFSLIDNLVLSFCPVFLPVSMSISVSFSDAFNYCNANYFRIHNSWSIIANIVEFLYNNTKTCREKPSSTMSHRKAMYILTYIATNCEYWISSKSNFCDTFGVLCGFTYIKLCTYENWWKECIEMEMQRERGSWKKVKVVMSKS